MLGGDLGLCAKETPFFLHLLSTGHFITGNKVNTKVNVAKDVLQVSPRPFESLVTLLPLRIISLLLPSGDRRQVKQNWVETGV